MPLNDGATTRRSRAKNGAMKLHQSPCAAPPCSNMRPGLPRSPQARVSTCAPSTATKARSGSIATMRSNHAGAGGFCPRKAASGAMGFDSATRAPSVRLGDFEQSGRAHAAADAHRHHDIARAAAFALDQGVTGHARAAHAIRMADRDRAAVDIELVVVDAEPVAAVENLDCEGFVEFPEADVVHLEAMRLEELRHREHRADAHLVRIAAGHGHAAIDPERLK